MSPEQVRELSGVAEDALEDVKKLNEPQEDDLSVEAVARKAIDALQNPGDGNKLNHLIDSVNQDVKDAYGITDQENKERKEQERIDREKISDKEVKDRISAKIEEKLAVPMAKNAPSNPRNLRIVRE